MIFFLNIKLQLCLCTGEFTHVMSDDAFFVVSSLQVVWWVRLSIMQASRLSLSLIIGLRKVTAWNIRRFFPPIKKIINSIIVLVLQVITGWIFVQERYKLVPLSAKRQQKIKGRSRQWTCIINRIQNRFCLWVKWKVIFQGSQSDISKKDRSHAESCRL